MPAPEESYLALCDLVLAVIQNFISEAQGGSGDELTPDTPFMDAGLDSLDMLKVRNALHKFHKQSQPFGHSLALVQRRLRCPTSER